MFVLDASVASVWFFEDEDTARADRVLGRLRETSGLVPPIWPLEVGNILLVGERRGRLTIEQTEMALTLLAGLPIVIDGANTLTSLAELLNLGRDHGLSSYDASYLALARREQIPLATLDARLAAAARAAGVELLG